MADKGEYKVQLTVIDQRGTCSFGHKVGDVITFTERGIEGEICFSALYSVLPKVMAMRYGAEFPWLKDRDVATHACPDAYNPLVFEVRRIRE
ncbi:MAG TPA: TIGR04076 family protein [Anaerolineae bacterium]|nr:TIGR04076 family protein [Anaerolineae bacterium]